MLSFFQYLEERKVDPFALAKRVSRRFGKKEKYGKWLRTEPGGHIPLSNYKAREANSVFSRSDKLRQKIGGRHYYNSTNKEEHKKALKKFNDAHKPATFNIKDLRPTQPYVETHDDLQLQDKLKKKTSSKVIVATHKGRHYILDGHHTVMAAALRGDKTIDVHHINMDDYK